MRGAAKLLPEVEFPGSFVEVSERVRLRGDEGAKSGRKGSQDG